MEESPLISCEPVHWLFYINQSIKSSFVMPPNVAKCKRHWSKGVKVSCSTSVTKLAFYMGWRQVKSRWSPGIEPSTSRSKSAALTTAPQNRMCVQGERCCVYVLLIRISAWSQHSSYKWFVSPEYLFLCGTSPCPTCPHNTTSCKGTWILLIERL